VIGPDGQQEVKMETLMKMEMLRNVLTNSVRGLLLCSSLVSC
jgi:hypothetical protein